MLFDFADNTLLAPGAHIVVTRNTAAFSRRYAAAAGTVTIAGEFASGNLSNDGERLVLTGRTGSVIRDFIYDDQAPWPATADGGGFSLVLIAPRTNPDANVASNWRASATRDGTPGFAESAGYTAWKSLHGIVLDSDDTDGDGLTALAEYALGTLPNAPSASSHLTPGVVRIDGQDYATIDIRRSLAAADDVTLVVETSGDLAAWAPDAVFVSETTHAEDGTTLVTYRRPQPLSDHPQAFLRASFSLR